MSKLVCKCGHIISDTLYPSPTEGRLLPQHDDDRIQSTVYNAVGAFFAAVLAGRRSEWIRGFFSDPYPLDIADASVVSDIVDRFERTISRSVAECEQCGRLWVQVTPGRNEYRSYSPDQPGYAGILRPAAGGEG